MSEEIKSHNIRVEDIPQDAKVVLTQNSKPYLSMFVLILLGLSLCWFRQTRIFGILFTAAVSILLYVSKNRKLLTVTDKFIVAHEADEQSCRIYYYDEIVKWDLNHVNGSDVVVLYFADATLTSVPALYIFPVARALRKFMKDKETVHLKHFDLVDHSPRVKKKKKNKKNKKK